MELDMHVTIDIAVSAAVATALQGIKPSSTVSRTSVGVGAEVAALNTFRYKEVSSGMIPTDQVAEFIGPSAGGVRKKLGKSAVPTKGEVFCFVLGLEVSTWIVDVLIAMPLAFEASELAYGLVSSQPDMARVPGGVPIKNACIRHREVSYRAAYKTKWSVAALLPLHVMYCKGR